MWRLRNPLNELCHSEAEPKNLKDCSGQAPAKNVWTSEILHGACPETLRGACPEILHGLYPEHDQNLRGVYTERSECAQDDAGRGIQNDMRRVQSDSRRIQDDRLDPEIHNR